MCETSSLGTVENENRRKQNDTSRPKHEVPKKQNPQKNISWGSIEINTEKPKKSYSPQKIVRKNPLIIDLIHKMGKINVNEPVVYPTGFYSSHSYVDKSTAKDSFLFYEQIKFMENAEDNYTSKYNVADLHWGKGFEWMSLEQKRAYFSWRTKVRNGQKVKTNNRFISIYLSELINNVPYLNDEKEIFSRFLGFVNEINHYMENEYSWEFSVYHLQRILWDFYIINHRSFTVDTFNALLPVQYKHEANRYFLSYETPKSKKYTDSKELLSQISTYSFLNSIFYKSEYGYLLEKAIDEVFEEVEKYAIKFKIVWFDAVFSTIEKVYNQKMEWHPYDELIYYPGSTIEDKTVTLPNESIYIIKNGRGYYRRLIASFNPYASAIGYTIKLIENELRKALGFRSKLSPNSSHVIHHLDYHEFNNKNTKKKYQNRLKYFSTQEFTDLVINKTNEFFDSTGIERMVMSKTYQRKKEMARKRAEKAKKIAAEKAKDTPMPVIIEIDRSKFESIRKVSEEIQSALIVEDENHSNNDYDTGINSASKSQETTIATPVKNNNDNEYYALVNSLSDLERQILNIIVCEESELLKKLNQIAIEHNEMLETIIDSINEKALEFIEDNIIDFSDVPYVYEDYLEELKIVLQEEKNDKEST